MQNTQQDGQSDIGLIGLAVMGQNLVLNMEDNGFTVSVYNRTISKVDEFIEGPAKGKNIVGCQDVEQFVNSLKAPRRIMLMVKAGEVVDRFIDMLLPYLSKEDIIIDGGNSLYTDTIRRTKDLADKGINYIGAGVSGGEEGARFGPSIMPGGNPKAWSSVKPILQAISAKVDDEPCCNWVGDNGAGHYVKMVHNGIEYGDMQLISEAYHLLREGLNLSGDEIHAVFSGWNTGVLDSYLIEITRDILAVKDEDDELVLDKILDAAGQKGTGKWTGINALDLGIPLTLIGEAVFARCLSARKEERVYASKQLPQLASTFSGDKTLMINAIHDALYAAKIISYAQGFMLLSEAAKEYDWQLNYADIALMWRGGCIIRSQFLGSIRDAYNETPDLQNILFSDYFKDAIAQALPGWRRAVGEAVALGIPVPALSSALAFYDGYRTERLPANLLQAQRDYFGAHTYERLDKPRGEFFHTNWTGRGGNTSATQYDV